LKVVSVGNKVVTFIQKSKTKIKILISLWQILQGLGATFAIPFPPFYSQAVSAVGGLLQIELPSIMPLDCMWPTNFYSKLIFKCVWPLCTYALLALLSKVLRKFGKDARADGCIDFGFFLMFILYPSISNGLLSIFYCVPLKDGTSWLRVDLSIQCADASGTIARHTTMLIFAFVMLGLHTVGTPALYGYLFFWKHKGVLDALKEQELDDHYREKLEAPKQYVTQRKTHIESEEEPRLDESELLPGYLQKLTSGYEYRTYWFELFETVRKVLLVGVPCVFPERGGTAQLFWGLLVCFLSASFYMMAAPYIEDSDDHLAQLAQLQVFLTLLSSLALRAVPPSEVVGSMVTVILFAVPLSGVIFQTELFDDLLWLFGKLRSRFVRAFPNFHPPAPKLPSKNKLLTAKTSTAGSTTTKPSGDSSPFDAPGAVVSAEIARRSVAAVVNAKIAVSVSPMGSPLPEARVNLSA